MHIEHRNIPVSHKSSNVPVDFLGFGLNQTHAFASEPQKQHPCNHGLQGCFGSGYGNRTHLSCVRGMCPEPIDEPAKLVVFDSPKLPYFVAEGGGFFLDKLESAEAMANPCGSNPRSFLTSLRKEGDSFSTSSKALKRWRTLVVQIPEASLLRCGRRGIRTPGTETRTSV